jgi:alpha-glutamyl/putrescinyl thymine pyrophosphorylase clade 1
MTPTIVFDTYWQFAAERQAMFYRRLTGAASPWTSDPILRTFRFTNAYRACDRVSQYLIREIQYHPDRPQDPHELFFRTLLFKMFNRIETWQAIERSLGPVIWEHLNLDMLTHVLQGLATRGIQLYSPAYIMPSPPFGHLRKFANHLALLVQMMHDRLPDQICQARSLRTVYETMLTYPGLGPFLAFQYTIDLNYSAMLNFDEGDFVVAGPGALDGISKCFVEADERSAEELIYWVADRQDSEFKRMGLQFDGLFGRRLQPIDCQNLFCEISKYSRVAHPEVPGIAHRHRIKRLYRPDARPLPPPSFPPRWRVKIPRQPIPKSGATQIAMF